MGGERRTRRQTAARAAAAPAASTGPQQTRTSSAVIAVRVERSLMADGVAQAVTTAVASTHRSLVHMRRSSFTGRGGTARGVVHGAPLTRCEGVNVHSS